MSRGENVYAQLAALWLVQTAQALGARSLFLLGQLCRHATDFIDAAAEAGVSKLTLRRCMAIMLAYFNSLNGRPRLPYVEMSVLFAARWVQRTNVRRASLGCGHICVAPNAIWTGLGTSLAVLEPCWPA